MKKHFSLMVLLLLVMSVASALLTTTTLAATQQDTTIDAFRLIQYDKGTQPFGCRITGLNSPITTPKLGASSALSAARNVIMIKIEELLSSNKTSIQTILNREDVSGVLIVLPPNDEISTNSIDQFKTIEKQFLISTFDKPIYFIFQNEKTAEMLSYFEHLNEFSLLSESYQAVVSEGEAKPIDQTPVVNLFSTLHGKPSEKSQTIGIVAHYDSISSIPGLVTTFSADGSGMIGLLEISRLFQKLYSTPSTKASHNLLFILTGGSRLGYAGTKHWIKQTDPRLVNQLDFVLCLDSLTSHVDNDSFKLFMHISEKTNDKNVINLYKHFVQTAKQLQIDLQFIEKKIDRELVWEHEVFAKKGIVSATISTQSVPSSSMLTRTNSLDISKVDIDQLRKSIKLIAESLARHLYDIDHHIRFFEDENDKFIRAFIKNMESTSRFTPILSKESDLVKALKLTLQQFSTNDQVVQTQDFLLSNSAYKFYTNTKVKLSLLKVTPIAFDLILISSVIIYLLFLHVVLVGPKQVVNNIASLFEKQERKRK
ncbi:hypothetical protein C9374_009649 [Naegleria lovaniensis]|uniref:BOS complex subunit NCLN n=1 Tax=Naegleria lovaniensis TaxID=51637 RepID=A0AA88H5A9_NAELO|nr:uncharacterized protein C9374_009649 [Naegleria lovaniensis]KAG2393072.1 hypothetical protein C9374_009649 [Naegleria lovaniensis]